MRADAGGEKGKNKKDSLCLSQISALSEAVDY